MLLRVEHVTKRYARPAGERVALDNVSLTVDRGQMIGVFGPSGSGKTTLLRIASGLQRPDHGAVIYNGQRLDAMSSAERIRFPRREVACVWSDGSTPPRLPLIHHPPLSLLPHPPHHLPSSH